jgi:hypothetical protein
VHASIPFLRVTSARSAVNPWIIAITVTLSLLDTATANVSLPPIAEVSRSQKEGGLRRLLLALKASARADTRAPAKWYKSFELI